MIDPKRIAELRRAKGLKPYAELSPEQQAKIDHRMRGGLISVDPKSWYRKPPKPPADQVMRDKLHAFKRQKKTNDKRLQNKSD